MCHCTSLDTIVLGKLGPKTWTKLKNIHTEIYSVMDL